MNSTLGSVVPLAMFIKKTTSFFIKKNYPPLIKNYGPPPYKKLQLLISAFIKNSSFGNNRDPWGWVDTLVNTSGVDMVKVLMR